MKKLKITLIETNSPEWLGLIKISAFQTIGNEWVVLHVGNINQKCFQILKTYLKITKSVQHHDSIVCEKIIEVEEK